MSDTPVEPSPSAVARPAAPRAEVVERHLSRLDADALSSFVADLWAARGFETETDRESGVVVGTRAAESVVVLPYRPPRVGRGSVPDRAVDVVVAPGGGGRARRLADERGARLVDAAALRGMLLYAVERGAADRLCERHLGAPLAELRPSARSRVRSRLAAVESPVTASTAAVALVVVAVALVAGGGAATGGLGLVGGGETAAPDGVGLEEEDEGGTRDADPDSTPVSVGTGSVIADSTSTSSAAGTTNRQPASIEGVPGLTAEGIVDLNALAAAHERAVANGSYTIWADTYRPPANVTDAGRVQEDVDVRVEGDRFSVVTSVETTASGSRSVVRRVYGEGDARYVADATGGAVTYHRVGPDRAAPSVGPTPDYFASTAVLRYLSTPETTVTGRTEFDGRPAYRVAGRGLPSGLGFEGLVSYSVAAVVSSDGLVYDLTAQYSVVRDSRRYDVQFEWTYDRLGETTVERPAWVDREFDDAGPTDAGNATATVTTAAATAASATSPSPASTEDGGDGRGSG